MNLSKLIDTVVKSIRANGPELLTALGVAGVAVTTYHTAKATVEATRLLDASESQGELDDLDRKERAQWLVRHTAALYVPAGISAVGTVACILAASKGHASRTAAAVTAYSVTERAFNNYREKMIEEVGRRKDEKVRAAVAQQNVLENPPPPSNQIMILGKDEVLCCEEFTGRYFRSSVTDLKKAVNETNAWIIQSRKATLNDFYNEIGLPATDVSANLGWDTGELMELLFSGTLTEEDQRPCLAFSYSPNPAPLR